MKRYIKILLLASLALAACGKDEITIVDDPSADPTDDTDTLPVASGTVVVVFSPTGDATVSGTVSDLSATVDGNGVTIVYTGSEMIEYDLSGTTSNGYLKIYSTKKQTIALNNVSIANPAGAAINVQGTQANPNKGKAVYLVVNGSNSLADGSTYSNTPSSEDEKGVIFAEGQIIVSGSGSLSVTANGKSGIASDDYVHFTDNAVLTVTSTAGHGVRANDYVQVSSGTLNISVSADMKKGISSDSLVLFDGGNTTIHITGGTAYDSDDGDYTGSAGIKADSVFRMENGTLTITNSGTGGKGINCDGSGIFSGGTLSITCTGSNYGSSGGGGHWGGGSNSNSVSAKGIKCDGDIDISGGSITVSASSHEGIESKGKISISGGQVYSYSKDDAINAAGNMTISGGYVCAHSTGNDGMDANGNLYIEGGVVYAIGASSPEMAVDANTEGGYKLYVNGGTLIAIGGLERGASLAQTCYSTNSWNRSTWYALTVGNEVYAFKTPASGGSPLVVSGNSQPTLASGVSVSGGTSYFNGTLTVGGSVSGGSNVSLSTYTGGGGGGWWH